MKLILASASPRRAEILRSAGIKCDILAVEMDETPLPGESAGAMARRLAEMKARAVAAKLTKRGEPCLVIGADTVVEMDGEAMGKPGSAAAAREMLQKLSGRSHRVLTGIAVLRLPDGALRTDLESTVVHFSAIPREEIEQYAATEEPLDKAGAYAIQGVAGRFIERIDGCYFNVVGLPLALLYRTIQAMGWRAGLAASGAELPGSGKDK